MDSRQSRASARCDVPRDKRRSSAASQSPTVGLQRERRPRGFHNRPSFIGEAQDSQTFGHYRATRLQNKRPSNCQRFLDGTTRPKVNKMKAKFSTRGRNSRFSEQDITRRQPERPKVPDSRAATARIPRRAKLLEHHGNGRPMRKRQRRRLPIAMDVATYALAKQREGPASRAADGSITCDAMR